MVEEEFKVRYYEIGPDHNIPLWTLQSYFQQAAAIDAKNLSYGTEKLFAEGIAWVLISIKFKILKNINTIKKVKIKTWHCYSDKIYSRRDFVIYDEKGDEFIHGTSLWLILDLATRKIARTPQSMLEQKIDSIKDIEPEMIKTPDLQEETPLKSIIIRTRVEDLDMNNHVNNTHFTAWAIEGMPEDIRKNKSLKEISVNFKAEVKAGENIIVQTYLTEENKYQHILLQESSGKITASAYSIWV